ncbi:hypothetical protein SynPROS91_01501 [Synechococcus sp. PROS-9-1]|nr:hypothetical protein SynPROS91_01501 [Synechococcus sp. PROS-9-1]
MDGSRSSKSHCNLIPVFWDLIESEINGNSKFQLPQRRL